VTNQPTHVPTASGIPRATWQKSSYSGSNEGQCLEVADLRQTLSSIAVRDSKNPTGPALLFPPAVFSAFIADAVQGRFNA
jgi:hypothetical protein